MFDLSHLQLHGDSEIGDSHVMHLVATDFVRGETWCDASVTFGGSHVNIVDIFEGGVFEWFLRQMSIPLRILEN